jgi:hypothetical protein
MMDTMLVLGPAMILEGPNHVIMHVGQATKNVEKLNYNSTSREKSLLFAFRPFGKNNF